MFYQLPHFPVSPISSIDPLPGLFPEESPTSIFEHPPLVYEFPPSISDVPPHAYDKPLALSLTCPLILLQLWIMSVLLTLMHFVVPIR